ncbi:MAG: hypothetical protein CMK71_08870 [Pseudomonadaceae bacterium]|nr:hypothetical protein [Pseudomonadaceae bacterium]
MCALLAEVLFGGGFLRLQSTVEARPIMRKKMLKMRRIVGCRLPSSPRSGSFVARARKLFMSGAAGRL